MVMSRAVFVVLAFLCFWLATGLMAVGTWVFRGHAYCEDRRCRINKHYLYKETTHGNMGTTRYRPGTGLPRDRA